MRRILIKYQKPKHEPKNKDALLFWAVANGKLSDLYVALEAVDPSDLSYVVTQEDEHGRTLLHYAGYLDLKNIVLYLLNLDSSLVTDSDGQTVMHAILYQGNLASLQVLLHKFRHDLHKQLFELQPRSVHHETKRTPK